jgi:type VI secretion system secreted protein VgrG
VSTGEDVSIASGKSLLASVVQSISLFAQNAGAKLFAAKGKVELEAQSDAMELTALQNMKLTSLEQLIEMSAQKEILLTSGAAYIRIKGSNIEVHAPGTIDIKRAKKNAGWAGQHG